MACDAESLEMLAISDLIGEFEEWCAVRRRELGDVGSPSLLEKLYSTIIKCVLVSLNHSFRLRITKKTVLGQHAWLLCSDGVQCTLDYGHWRRERCVGVERIEVVE